MTESLAGFACTAPRCSKYGVTFPIIDGIPILIDEAGSLFPINDFRERKETTFKAGNKLLSVIMNILPSLSLNVGSKRNYPKFASLLCERNNKSKVLVIGGGILGKGIKRIINNKKIEFIEVDVFFGPRTKIIADAHDIPLSSESVDGVIIQAVLEHVIDPVRVAEEIYRVLKPCGLIYAETPFLQHVHLQPYDFQRFTHLGHRFLFKHFVELDSGVVCGPGMALACSIRSFILSFSNRKLYQALMSIVSNLMFFWLKYFDYYLRTTKGGINAASGTYFLGEKAEEVISAGELIKGYKGL
jgi:SAM-dependent methyltransferase